MKRSRSTVWLVLVGAAVVAALADQLRRPAGERTWHGRVAGIPYDFRPPTVARLRDTFWNPDNPSLLAPHAFGVGWSVNLYRLAHPKAP